MHPVARTLSRLLEEPSHATPLQGVYFISYTRILPLHVLAHAGHLRAEDTSILGSYLTVVNSQTHIKKTRQEIIVYSS
jgi:hypothetical protein